jgi:hypothetical protein
MTAMVPPPPPGRAHEAPGRRRVGAAAAIRILDRLERRADPVAQRREPRNRLLLQIRASCRRGSIFNRSHERL